MMVTGYQVMLAAAPGHILIGATSHLQSPIFDTEEEARSFLADIIQENERAGRKVAESKIVKVTRDIEPS